MSVETLYPNAQGDETNLNPSSGENWECVAEQTNDRYVYAFGGDARDLYNFPSLSGSGEITQIEVFAYATGSDFSFPPEPYRLRIYIKTGGDTLDYESFTSPSGWNSKVWETNPETSLAWTVADIASLQAGPMSDLGENGSLNVYRFKIEVTFSTAGPGAPSTFAQVQYADLSDQRRHLWLQPRSQAQFLVRGELPRRSIR